MPTLPPTIDPAPPDLPQRGGGKALFSDRVDAFIRWFITAPGQFYATCMNAYNNATEAYSSAGAAANSANAAAASATAAASTAGALAWSAATVYAQYAAAISPIDLQTYRRKTAGSSATDPSADSTNWTQISGVDAATKRRIRYARAFALRATAYLP